MDLSWMAWTPHTIVFFCVIAILISFMIFLAIKYPEVPRVGILGIETTRGDRLFISLLGSAFISLAWLGLSEYPIWGVLIPLGIYTFFVFRWV